MFGRIATCLALAALSAACCPDARALVCVVSFVQYDVSDLVPEGPDAEKQTAALADEIRAKVMPETWKNTNTSLLSGRRTLVLNTPESRLPAAIETHLLAAYTAAMTKERKQLHERLAARVKLEFPEQPLSKAIEDLGRSSGLKLKLAESCKGLADRPVALSANNSSAGSALKSLARQAGLDWRLEGDAIVLAPARKDAPWPLYRRHEDRRLAEEPAEQAAGPRTADEITTERLNATLITLDCTRTPIRDCLQTIADHAKVKIVIADGWQANGAQEITFRAKDIKAGTALRWVLMMGRSGMELRDGVIYIK